MLSRSARAERWAWVMRSVSSQREPSAREETITPTTQALHSSTEALGVIKSLSQDPVGQGIDDLLLDDWQAASDRRSLSSVQRFDFTPVHPAFAHRSHRQLTCSHSHRYPHTRDERKKQSISRGSITRAAPAHRVWTRTVNVFLHETKQRFSYNDISFSASLRFHGDISASAALK